MKTMQLPRPSLFAAPASFFPSFGKIAALAAITTFIDLPITRAEVMTPSEINIGPGEILSANLPGGAAGLVIDTNTISIAPTGALDMRDNALIVRNDNFAKVYGYVVTGYNLGDWYGKGITSITAAGDPAHLHGLGIINNAEAHLPEFAGRPTPANIEILVKYTLYGDANLDGDVNEVDVALMGTGTGWYHGDFNYSGTVDTADYALLNAALPNPLPEPGSMCLLFAGAGAVGSRRSRKV